MSYHEDFSVSLRLTRRGRSLVFVESGGGTHHLSGVSWEERRMDVYTDDGGIVFSPVNRGPDVVRLEIENSRATIAVVKTMTPFRGRVLDDSRKATDVVQVGSLISSERYLEECPTAMKFDGRFGDRLVEWSLQPVVPMKLRRLYIPLEYAKHFEVVQINAGANSLMLGPEELPARAYSSLGGEHVYPQVIMPGFAAKVILRLYPGSNFGDVDAMRASVIFYACPMESPR